MLKARAPAKQAMRAFSGFDAEQTVEISQHRPIWLTATYINSYHIMTFFYEFHT
jgi:hypothetical protein